MHPICLFLAFLLITQLFKRITAICSKYLFVIFFVGFCPFRALVMVAFVVCLGCYPKLCAFALSGPVYIVFPIVLVVVVRRTPRRGSIKKPNGNALDGHAPRISAPKGQKRCD